MKKILINIFLIFSSPFLLAQPGEFNLKIQFNSGYSINKIFKGEKFYQGCSAWKLRTVVLLDSLQNKLGEQQFWSKGMDHKWDGTIEFSGIKYSNWYLLEINENEKKSFDTLRIRNLVNHKMDYEFNKAETARVIQNQTFIDQMQNGDSLTISFSEYGCEYANSEILVLKFQDQYTIQLIERLSKVEKVFTKVDLSEYDLKIIRAFEFDTFRKYRSNECHDMGYNYSIKFNEQSRKVQDSCGDWGGYYYLKRGLFRD